MFARATICAASVLMLAPLLVSSPCLAGTGGIFATGNSGSPPSSPDGAMVPLPGSGSVTPPPVLRGTQNMQSSFEHSSLPSLDQGGAETNLPLRGLSPGATAGQQVTGQSLPAPSAPAPPAALSGQAFRQETPGRVESFFQIEGMNQYPGSRNSANKEKRGQDNHKKSARSGVSRFLWHTLDNMGVPMFFGDAEDDLDPNLARGYIITGENGARAAQAPDKNNATANGAAGNQPSPHKIPESELEGVNFSGKDDAPSATP